MSPRRRLAMSDDLLATYPREPGPVSRPVTDILGELP